MGHASIATTNLYLHHLGTASDRVGLARLNQSAGCIRGAQGDPAAESQEPEPAEDLSSDLVRRAFEMSGAKGTRTPDLLVANETRYRLRHSPADRGWPISTQTLPPSSSGYLARFAACVGRR